jgi:hypothetical protein
VAWRKVIGYELGWQCTAKSRQGAISLRIEGPIGPISEEIADLMPLGSEDYHGLLEILHSGKTIWYESGRKMLITREQKPSELCEDNPATSIEEDSFRGYNWQEDRYSQGQ